MKKFTPKPLALACIFFFSALSSALFAEGSDLHFALEADLSLRLAEQGEYVFLDVDSGGRRTLSYLCWDQKPLVMPEARLSLGWKNLYLCAGARAALSSKCGMVTDSDWLNVLEYPNCALEYASIKTNYTESDCRENFYYALEGEISYKFALTESSSFSPYAQISYVHSSFTALGASGSYYNSNQREENGYYGFYNDEDSSYDVEVSGEVLKLERAILQTWLGGRVDIGISQKFGIGFSMAMNLWTFAQSLDSHLFKGVNYLDEFDQMFGGIKASAELFYNLSKKDRLIFAVKGTAIQTLEGTSKSSTRKNASYNEYHDCSYWQGGSYYRCTSGLDFSSIEFALGYRHTFN